MIGEFRGKTRWLSNFHEAPIIYDGMLFATTEHAYQAAKTTCIGERSQIAFCETPAKAKKEGTKVTLREDWEEIKLNIMLEINRIKYNSYPELKELLISTRGEELVEGNNWGDEYWGKVNGKGENHLGRILMQIRSELERGYDVR